MPDPDLIVRDNAYWLYFAVWNSDVVLTLDELSRFD